MSNVKEEINSNESQVEDNEETIKLKFDEDGNVKITRRNELTPYFKDSDNRKNKIHLSAVPEICKIEPCQLGVDEAGRGPVLGPMVYGISYAPLSRKQLLFDLGCADSKSLTEQTRDAIFDKICKHDEEMGWAVEVISPNFICNSMYKRSKSSLNEVSMNSAIGLITKAVEAGVNIEEVYVDTVGPPESYQAKLKKLFPDFKIVVAKKADSTYPIVSAASICAKVSRDHALRAWQFVEGISIESDFGSGYPNDPMTKSWLKRNIDPVFGFPQIVRFSWSTAETILNSEAVPVEWEPEENALTNQDISHFFTKSPQKSVKVHKSKHAFFTERHLSSATDL
ncbi:ribonuclease H2 subunit A-like [Prorops nasuta]|uniref:ribonuclease H2 subunit A-like n=1 Tax=Prorops nasuta TaxID=863751 RepID=UPI0034CEAAA7